MTTKKCSKCGKVKKLSEFYFRKDKERNAIYYFSACKSCESIRSKQKYNKLSEEVKKAKSLKFAERKKYRRRHEDGFRQKEKDYTQKRRKKHPEEHLFHNAKQRSKRMNLEFNITREDIIIPDKCPLLNIPIKLDNNKISNDSPSVDRIDNTKGYIKGNIKVICVLANVMKRNATTEQLLLFCENMPKYLNQKY